MKNVPTRERYRKAKHSPTRETRPITHIGTCRATGLPQYQDRPTARTARRNAHEKGLHVTMCDTCAYWHVTADTSVRELDVA